MSTDAHHEPHTETHDQHPGHNGTTTQHDHAAMHGSGLNKMAASATLHCLTGCAIGEVLGLIIGTALGLPNGATIAISIALAFVFGFSLSTLPLLGAGLTLKTALTIVIAADTLSIATMELVDNAVNRYLLTKGKGHALTHEYHEGHGDHGDHGNAGDHPARRRRVPTINTVSLAVAIAAFMLGGLVVSIADDLEKGRNDGVAPTHSMRSEVER